MRLLVCQPLNGVRLTEASCAKRHASALEQSRQNKRTLECATCASCSVGAAHLAGKAPTRWPGGARIEHVELAVQVTPVAPKPAPVPQRRGKLVTTTEEKAHRELARKERKRAAQKRRATKSAKRASSGPRGKVYEWRGESLGIMGLAQTVEARDAGLTWQRIADRLYRGWSLEEAVTRPRYGIVRRGVASYEWQGRTLSAIEVARLPRAAGLSERTVIGRLERGWSVDRALNEPLAARTVERKGKGRYRFRGELVSLGYLTATPEARAYGLKFTTIESRITKLGWDPERAVTVAPAARRPR